MNAGWLARLPIHLVMAILLIACSMRIAPQAIGQQQAPGVAWPIEPAIVIEPFDAPETPWGRGHRGIDLAAEPATPVRSIGPGRVAYVGVIAGKPVVAIEHPSGLRSSYEPVDAEVTVGSTVQSGDRIGVVADPDAPGARLGHCSARCLHLGLRSQGVYVDPMLLLRSRAVLLPQGQIP